MSKAIFFDRDGTIIQEKNYIKDPNDVELVDNLSTVLPSLNKLNFELYLVSNQSGIARGYLTENDFFNINKKIDNLLGVKYFKDIAFCPHHPDFTEDCDCRKPKPGMILDLAKKHNIDLANSYIVGDKISDIMLIETANLKGGFLVQTGYGKEEANKIPNSIKEKVFIINNLNDVLDKLGEI